MPLTKSSFGKKLQHTPSESGDKPRLLARTDRLSKMHKPDKPSIKDKAGAATLEYVLVSTFAAVATIAALAVLGGVITEKIENLSQKIDQDLEQLETDGFSKEN